MANNNSNITRISLSHVPSTLPVFAALFNDLENAVFLREQLLAGNSAFEYAFIDAKMILSTTQILAAVFRAINEWLHGRLKTRNVHSEIVFSLSPNNNIAESFRRFGVTESTTSLIAIKVGVPPGAAGGGIATLQALSSDVSEASVTQHLSTHVQATSLPFDDQHLADLSDFAAVKKIYKLKFDGQSKGKVKVSQTKTYDSTGSGVSNETLTRDEVEQRREALTTILAMMALKGS